MTLVWYKVHGSIIWEQVPNLKRSPLCFMQCYLRLTESSHGSDPKFWHQVVIQSRPRGEVYFDDPTYIWKILIKTCFRCDMQWSPFMCQMCPPLAAKVPFCMSQLQNSFMPPSLLLGGNYLNARSMDRTVVKQSQMHRVWDLTKQRGTACNQALFIHSQSTGSLLCVTGVWENAEGG